MPAAEVVVPELRAFVAAVTFQTRIPVGRWIRIGGADVERAGAAFPFIGAGIGVLVGGTVALLSGSLGNPLAAAIGLAVGAAVTGALHLDALADTADALGARSREQALAIMRDHTIGAYGGVALVLDLLVKAAALAALAGASRVLGATVAATALARAASVALATLLPYARTEGGTGASIASGGAIRALIGIAVALALAVGVAGWTGLAMSGAALGVVAILAVAYRQWLGGVTGDTLGAAVELTEIVALVVAVAVVHAT